MATIVRGSVLETVSVTDFGAVGDGVTDDTSAIQAAEDFCAGNNRRLCFEEKSYYVASQIVKSRHTVWKGVSGKAGDEATFEYRSQGTTLVSGISGADALIFIDNPGTASNFNVHAGIRDMCLQGDLAINSSNSAIYIDTNIRWQYFENVVIKHFNKGLESFATGLIFGERLVFSHCKWTLYMVDTSDCWFTDCHFGSSQSSVLDNAVYFSTGAAGVYHHGGQNLRFKGCRFQVQWQGAGGHFIGTRNLSFDNTCEFDLNGRQGLLLIDCSDVRVLGDFFKNNNENNVVTPSPGTKWSHIQIQSGGETFTADAGTDEITVSGTYRYRGTRCQFTSSGTLPAGISSGVVYWLGYETLTTKKLYTNEKDLQAGTNEVNITSTGTGTHYLHQYVKGVSVSASISGLKGETEDAYACVFLRGVDTDAAAVGGIIDGVTLSGCAELSADYILEVDEDGSAAAIGSSVGNVIVGGSVLDPNTGIIATAEAMQFSADVRISDDNTGINEVFEIADASYGWYSAFGVKVIAANDAITSLRFVTLNNEGAYEGQKITVFRKGTGASNVTVRDDALATLVSLAVNESATFVFIGAQWYWNGTVSI